MVHGTVIPPTAPGVCQIRSLRPRFGISVVIPFRWPWQILVWLWHGYMMLHGWPQDNTANKKTPFVDVVWILLLKARKRQWFRSQESRLYSSCWSCCCKPGLLRRSTRVRATHLRSFSAALSASNSKPLSGLCKLRSGSYLVYQLQAPWAFWAMSSLRMVHVLGLDVPSRRLSDRYHQLEMQAPLVPNPTNASQLAMNPTVNTRGYGGVIITKASCQAWRSCSLRTKWE